VGNAGEHRPALELRVHGVSGTPPESLLDRPLVEQVGGDKIAGFFRPRLEEEQLDDAPNPFAAKRPGAARLIGYCWGGLTSGSAGRAFWLPLLPFTLINIAPRSRPLHAGKAQTWLIWYLCRLLALLTTGLLVLTGAGVGDDLMGWQCAHTTTCKDASPVKVFQHVFDKHQLSDEHMLLLGALVPVLLLSLLWLVSARTWNRYERTVARQLKTPDVNDKQWTAVEIGLESTLMWRNEHQVRRLRATHMQTGFALILWTLIAPTERPWGFHADDPTGSFSRAWLDIHTHIASVIAAVLMLYGCVMLAVPSYVGRRDVKVWQNISKFVVWPVLGALGAWEIYGLGFDKGWIHRGYLVKSSDEHLGGGLPYFATTVFWEFAVAMIVLAVLLVVVVVAACHRSDSDAPPQQRLCAGLWGLPCAAFATLGVVWAAALAAGLYTYAGAWLTTGSLKPGFSAVSHTFQHLSAPDVVRAANQAYLMAIAFLVLVLVLAGASFGTGFTLAKPPKPIALVIGAILAGGSAVGDVISIVIGSTPWIVVFTVAAAAALIYIAGAISTWMVNPAAIVHDYSPQAVAADAARATSIWRAIYLGRLVDRASLVVGPLALAGLVIACIWTGRVLVDHPDATLQKHNNSNLLSSDSLTAAGTGAYLAVLTILGLVALGVVAFKTPSLRRSVGILWDVASFWPRSSHPLAAPCYAERTVPDIVTYLSTAPSARKADAIVLAVHSQGTVISTAVIAQLDTYDKQVQADERQQAVLPRLGFLSFGCVLRRLYGKFFPVYFGPAELNKLYQRLGGDGPRWRNLWRYTDYLGGQVTAGPPPRVLGLPDEPPAWEWHRPDPPRFTRAAGDTCYSAPHRHSDFWADDSGYFQRAVVDLATQIRGTPAQPTATPVVVHQET
jgi:hypothetical protein